MNAETFKERKNLLEEFYKQRIKFNISKIEISQVEPEISLFSYMNDIHFETHITFTRHIFLIDELTANNLKPIICYALSYTILRKFYNPNFILTEDNTTIDYCGHFFNNNKLYFINTKLILKTHYDFYNADYDLYFSVLAELEQNNELIVSHTEPTTKEPNIINPTKTFKSDECIICLTNKPNILFCNCGHLCYCVNCYKIKTLSTCPICKTNNEIIRTLE